jgi:hypothetical protein
MWLGALRSLSVKSPDSGGTVVVIYNSRMAQGKQIFENDGLKLLPLAAGEIGLQYRKKSWL